MASETAHSLFATGLRNAHALENQALSLMDRQIERIESYPEMLEQLRRHRAETEVQITRLDQILGSMDESSSGLKDAALSFMGNLAALAHAPMQDEILKNTFANHAFENFEIASYKSLITMAELAGARDSVQLLQTSLGEEERMAGWIRDNIEMVTRRYVSLETQGQKSGI